MYLPVVEFLLLYIGDDLAGSVFIITSINNGVLRLFRMYITSIFLYTYIQCVSVHEGKRLKSLNK